MLKVNNRGREIAITGDSETLKKEIRTLMLAFCGEAAKRSKEAALDVYAHYIKTLAIIGDYLDDKFDIDIGELLEEEPEEVKQKAKDEEEPEEAQPTISKELDDAIETFFSALDDIIAKKKGDK